MRVFKSFLQGAARAAHDAGRTLMDEELGHVVDSAFVYALAFPDAMDFTAREAGETRFRNPQQFYMEHGVAMNDIG